MYAETIFPYLQNFSQEVQQLEEFFRIQKNNSPRSSMVQTSTISEYDLGGEGDLFKAPEPIMEESVMGLDPMTAISMISCGQNVIPQQVMKVTDIESIQSEQLLSEVFYECEKDLLAKSAIEEQLSEVSDVKIPITLMEKDTTNGNDRPIFEGPIQKSVSSGCLSSMEWIHGGAIRPNFLDFQGMDFISAYGMRRAFSEGDIQTLGNGNASMINSPYELPSTTCKDPIEERRQKLSRYRKKKTKRNFGRKIKYACRKALADTQPRIRGRFAKAEESEVSKK